jgi:hypothetical protein
VFLGRMFDVIFELTMSLRKFSGYDVRSPRRPYSPRGLILHQLANLELAFAHFRRFFGCSRMPGTIAHYRVVESCQGLTSGFLPSLFAVISVAIVDLIMWATN